MGPIELLDGDLDGIGDGLGGLRDADRHYVAERVPGIDGVLQPEVHGSVQYTFSRTHQ